MHSYTFATKLAAGCLTAAAALAIFTSNTRAQGGDKATVEKAPVIQESTHNWTGFYIGGNLGGAFTDFDFRGPDDGGFFEDVNVSQQFDQLPFRDTEFIVNGVPGGGGMGDQFATFFVPHHSQADGAVIGGGQVGYQHQFGHFVVGVEGSFDRTSTSVDYKFRDFATTDVAGGIIGNEPLPIFVDFGETSFTARRKAELDWVGSVMGKLGYAQGAFLFYGIGGVSWGDVNFWANDTASTDFTEVIGIIGDRPARPSQDQQLPPFLFQNLGNVTNHETTHHNEVRTGWTAGAGIEIAFSRVVSLGLEYRHSEFGNDHQNFSSDNGPIFPGSTNLEVDTDQVLVKMNINLSHFFGE